MGGFSPTSGISAQADLSTATGTLPAASMPALTGDVTSSVGTTATTIATLGSAIIIIAQGSRNAYTQLALGSNAWATVSDATLTGASAKFAIVTILNSVAATGAVAVGGEPYLYVYGRATGSAETTALNNLLSSVDLVLDVTGVDHYLSVGNLAVVPCGTSANAGKFDLYFEPSAAANTSTTCDVNVIGYIK